MGVVKQINTKNRTYYFYNNMINIKKFDPILLKIDRKWYKDIAIYNIGYITIKKIDDCEDIYSVNPLYLLINHANRYIEEKNENKYNDVWSGIKDKIEEVSIGEHNYEKDYIKVKFNSDDDLPLNKLVKFYNMTIIIRSVFDEDGKLYLQVFLNDTLYELNV